MLKSVPLTRQLSPCRERFYFTCFYFTLTSIPSWKKVNKYERLNEGINTRLFWLQFFFFFLPLSQGDTTQQQRNPLTLPWGSIIICDDVKHKPSVHRDPFNSPRCLGKKKNPRENATFWRAFVCVSFCFPFKPVIWNELTQRKMH